MGRGRYNVAIHEVCEFAHDPPLDDWVAVCTARNDAFEFQAECGLPPPTRRPCDSPPELRRWAAEVDAACQRSMHGETIDWLVFQRRLKSVLRAWRANSCVLSACA